MRAAVAALSQGRAELDVKLCQLVKLMRAGEPVRMSKRSGDFVTLREVVDEVGVDAVRFMMLFRKNDAPLEFDLAKVIEQSKHNPVFYVQYAHARTRCGECLRPGPRCCVATRGGKWVSLPTNFALKSMSPSSSGGCAPPRLRRPTKTRWPSLPA